MNSRRTQPDREEVPLRVAPVLRRAVPWLRYGGLLPLSALWAAGCLLVVQLVQVEGDWAVLSGQFDYAPGMFLLGGVLVWVLLALAWALTGRLVYAMVATGALTAVTAYANHHKLELRSEPVLPSDLGYLGQAGFLVEMVGIGGLLLLTCGVVATGVGAVWAVHRWPRLSLRPSRARQRRRWLAGLAVRVVTVAVALPVLGHAAHFNSPGNEVREAFDEAGARWAYWAQKANYTRNGFVAGFLYNLGVAAMERPAGYGPRTMAELADRYAAEAARLNRARTGSGLAGANVVVVLSESFADPAALDALHYDGDPIRYTRSVMRRTTSGTMLAQALGGGTANMEFEALTGLSMSQFAPQLTSPYQMLVPGQATFPSAVRLFEQRGYSSLAIHPYTTQMYRRETVYPTFGFDRFLSEGELQQERRIDRSPLISDASAFHEVAHQIERSDRPLFVNLVTMQNHFPTKDRYDDPWPVRRIYNNVVRAQVEGYLRGLAHSDAALRDFLAGLAASPERTAVIFYGDHQPPLWNERIQEAAGELGMRSTPYFIWANFELDRLPREPFTSPIHFLPMLFEAAGEPAPPFYALLRRLHEQIPAMELGEYLDRERGMVSRAELSDEAAAVLRDYRLVQYDLSVGKRYSLEVMFGSRPAIVSAAEQPEQRR